MLVYVAYSKLLETLSQKSDETSILRTFSIAIRIQSHLYCINFHSNFNPFYNLLINSILSEGKDFKVIILVHHIWLKSFRPRRIVISLSLYLKAYSFQFNVLFLYFNHKKSWVMPTPRVSGSLCLEPMIFGLILA